jgi:hypothetical protein
MDRGAMRIVGVIALTADLAIGTAQAGPLSDSAIFGQFNAIIFGNFSTGSDAEGRTVVGGNVTRGATFEAASTTAPVNYALMATKGRSLAPRSRRRNPQASPWSAVDWPPLPRSAVGGSPDRPTPSLAPI